MYISTELIYFVWTEYGFANDDNRNASVSAARRHPEENDTQQGKGKSEPSDWSFPGRDFAIWTISVETVISCVFFAFESWQIQNKHGPSAM